MRCWLAVTALLAAACGATPDDGARDTTTAGDAADGEGDDATVACPAACPASPAPCIPNVCRPETGRCEAAPLPVDTPCDRDADPATPDVCDAAGVCVAAEPPDPPPATCGPAAGALACGAVLGPAEGATDRLRHYDCGNVPLPGAEVVYTFTAAHDGVVELVVDAEPRAYLQLVVLEATCDDASCVGAPRVGDRHVLPVVAGRDYFVVLDATLGAVVEVAHVAVACAGDEGCDDGADDDFDGLVDCADPDCAGVTPCEPVEARCGDARDNDGDAYVDCADPDCDGRDGCEHGREASCADLRDNDADQHADCADDDCWADAACLVPCAAVAMPIACGALMDQVEAGQQAFAAHACAPGDWRVPEVVLTFAPDQAGTAHVGLATLASNARVVLYDGACAGTCAASAAVAPVDFAEPLSFTFTAGASYTIVIDAGPVGGALAPGVVLDRLRLRCE